MARIRPTVSLLHKNGYFHHEHRSKKGRQIWPEKPFSIAHKKAKEQLKIKELDNE